MACKTCGGNGGPQVEALPLSSTPTDTCSSCSKPSSSCGCESYCEEDHTATTIYKKYGYTLRIKQSFVWPAPEETVTLITNGIDSLSPGSIIWNPTAGYLTVVSFDFATQTIVAKNEDNPCNTYSGGETLPECTDFVVGPPQCGTGNTPVPNIPYLAADFISPADTDCALASVTNITGLTIGDTVSVNGYEYRIGDIIDSGTIELCNDGDGAPEGTVIFWDDDGDGVPNIPVLVTASENPCTRDSIVAGVLVACDGAEVLKPLVGDTSGQIPVWNNVTQRFELKNISAPFTECTSLTVDFTVDPIHVGSYLITVGSTAAFTAGDPIIIDGVFYTINTVDTGTTMHITPFVTPGAVETYPAGTSVCLFLQATQRPLVIVQDNNLVQVANTTAETAMKATTIPPNTLGTQNGIRFKSVHQFVNTSGGNVLYTPRVRFGSTVIFNSNNAALLFSTHANPRYLFLQGTIVGAGGLTLQHASVQNAVNIHVAAAQGTGLWIDGEPNVVGGNSVYEVLTEDAAIANLLEITIEMDTADPAAVANSRAFMVEAI